jgi:integrase
MAKSGVTLGKTKAKGKTYWQLRWLDPTSGKRRSENIGRVDGPKENQLSKRQAERQRGRKQAELEDQPGLRAGNNTPTIPEWRDDFTAMKRAEGKTDETVRGYELAADFLTAYFGERRQMHEITKAEARRFAAALRNNEVGNVRRNQLRKTGQVTADKHLRRIKTMFATANEELERMSGNPFVAVQTAQGRSKPWHKVTADEFWKLHGAAGDQWKLLLALCRLAALRRGDALSLTWGQVNWADQVLDVDQGKTELPCKPPISPELKEILAAVRRDSLSLRGDDPVIDPPPYLGNIGRDFDVLCKRAGVERYRDPLHTLRKSCIDDWAKAGYSASVVKAWAGHADITTTFAYYGQVEQRDYERAANTPLLGGGA